MLLRETEPSEITEPIELKGRILTAREFIMHGFLPAVIVGFFGAMIAWISWPALDFALLFTVIVLLGLVGFLTPMFIKSRERSTLRLVADNDSVSIFRNGKLESNTAYSELIFRPEARRLLYVAIATDKSGNEIGLDRFDPREIGLDLINRVILTKLSRSGVFSRLDQKIIQKVVGRCWICIVLGGTGILVDILVLSDVAGLLTVLKYVGPAGMVIPLSILLIPFWFLGCWCLTAIRNAEVITSRGGPLFHRTNELNVRDGQLRQQVMAEGTEHDYGDVKTMLGSPLIKITWFTMLPIVAMILASVHRITNEVTEFEPRFALILLSVVSALTIVWMMWRLKRSVRFQESGAYTFTRVGHTIHARGLDGISRVYKPNRVPNELTSRIIACGGLITELKSPDQPSLLVDFRYLRPVESDPSPEEAAADARIEP